MLGLRNLVDRDVNLLNKPAGVPGALERVKRLRVLWLFGDLRLKRRRGTHLLHDFPHVLPLWLLQILWFHSLNDPSLDLIHHRILFVVIISSDPRLSFLSDLFVVGHIRLQFRVQYGLIPLHRHLFKYIFSLGPCNSTIRYIFDGRSNIGFFLNNSVRILSFLINAHIRSPKRFLLFR